jgi:hypothetical protein
MHRDDFRTPSPYGLPDGAARVLALVLTVIASLLLLTAMVALAK